MDIKQREMLSNVSKLLFAIILATGMIIAASIFSNTIADRPMMGSFSGSISQSAYSDMELMSIDELRYYLSMYPAESYTYTDYDRNGNPISGRGLEEVKMSGELQRNITSGTWPGFPYVQLGERLYFSKQAVDDWFFEQGKAQLSVK